MNLTVFPQISNLPPPPLQLGTKEYGSPLGSAPVCGLLCIVNLMSGLADGFFVVDVSFVTKAVGALVTINGSEMLGGLSCDTTGCCN